MNNVFDGFDELFKGMPVAETAPQVDGNLAVDTDTNATSGIEIEMPLAPNPGNLAQAQAKLKMIEKELNMMYVEREEVINTFMLALISSQNMLLLGMPGTAKSALTYEVCSRIINSCYFQWMLNKTSDPSEILGPFSIKQMENDKFVRITDGKLPEAHIAFIDECYKANAPVLNQLLPIMNEKIFYNDGKANTIPLITMIGASNEGPEDESLMAFHDRFLFRLNVAYVRDAGNKKKMISNYVDARAGLLSLASKATISIDELKMLNDATKTVTVSKDIINKFVRFISDLDKQGIHVSDRRQNECVKVLQSSAVFNGRSVVGLDDFRSLVYVLWNKEEEIPIIQDIITKMVNPFDDKFKELRIQFEQVKNDVENSKTSSEKSSKALQAKAIVEKLTTKLNKLINEASINGKDVTEYSEYRTEMTTFTTKAVQDALGGSVLGGDGNSGVMF